ncbi:hypothetical protein AC578_10543 [Pseudocercospora eumusae]|uniref:Uncharacterized protein n=1 Tax=Pseudocercospora eumusae TaxID=321146 RepID=A0A139H616_9PEZI|nr:hypothetical protein AC578_10543 [Pseudocercospora eumusae]
MDQNTKALTALSDSVEQQRRSVATFLCILHTPQYSGSARGRQSTKASQLRIPVRQRTTIEDSTECRAEATPMRRLSDP